MEILRRAVWILMRISPFPKLQKARKAKELNVSQLPESDDVPGFISKVYLYTKQRSLAPYSPFKTKPSFLLLYSWLYPFFCVSRH